MAGTAHKATAVQSCAEKQNEIKKHFSCLTRNDFSIFNLCRRFSSQRFYNSSKNSFHKPEVASKHAAKRQVNPHGDLIFASKSSIFFLHFLFFSMIFLYQQIFTFSFQFFLSETLFSRSLSLSYHVDQSMIILFLFSR